MPKAAGYSGTPLARKLGVGEGMVVAAMNAPRHYADLLEPLPAGARVSRRLPRTPDFVHLFTAERADLDARLRALRKTLHPDGTVWVSWPKKAAQVATDITEDTIRQVALPLGFVDVKVCAVDDIWSGLKLVIRRELRRPPASAR